MVKIESLKDYIGVLNEDDFIRLSKQIYDITDFICEDYPKNGIFTNKYLEYLHLMEKYFLQGQKKITTK